MSAYQKKSANLALLITLVLIFVLAPITIVVSSIIFNGDKSKNAGIEAYYINPDTGGLSAKKRSVSTGTNTEMVKSALNLIIIPPDHSNLRSAFPEYLDFDQDKGAVLNGEILELSFTDSYKQMQPAEELLFRGALVLTMTGLPFVSEVVVMVDGEQLTDAGGVPMGTLSKDSFLLNERVYPDVPEYKDILLYFVNSETKLLESETRRVAVNPNQLLSKYIVEELINGPQKMGLSAVLPTSVKLINISKDNNICYVNLNSEFINKMPSDPELGLLTIYSIVNSVTELSDIKKVQFLIDSIRKESPDGVYDFTKQYDRDESLIDKE